MLISMEKKEDRAVAKASRFMTIGFVLIAVAVVCAVLIMTASVWKPDKASPSPEIEVTSPPETPAPTPLPTPSVERISLYAFGRELTEDGFTAYVGDDPFTLSVEIVSDTSAVEVEWFVSDSESISLSVSDDGLSCEFTALKPSGKNELTIRCHGCELTVPVYLWEH